MNVKSRRITLADILPAEQYAAERKSRRAAMIEYKRNRRVAVGPHATFYFENYAIMLGQVQEMLHTEKGGAAQIEDELVAYNPLIPQGAELVATLMFEIEDPVRRLAILRTLTKIEESAFIEIGGERVMAAPEQDVERTAPDGKTSSVHFLHFHFSPAQIAAFKSSARQVLIGFTHANYAHMTALAGDARAALAEDFA